MPQKYTTIGDIATLVRHRGPTTLPGAPPDTGQGRVIICLHDAGGSSETFDPLLDDLARAHSPLAYDQPGHGRSGSLDAFGSVVEMVAHLRGLADDWSIESAVLVGEGLGAAVALQAADDDPAWVEAVVVIGDLAADDALDAEIEQLTAIVSGKARREFDRSGYSPDTGKEVYQRVFAAWVKTDPRATLGARRAQRAWSLDTTGSVPTLVVVGEDTEADRAAVAEELAARLPAGRSAPLPAAGRRGVAEQPTALAEMIVAFLADLNDNPDDEERG